MEWSFMFFFNSILLGVGLAMDASPYHWPTAFMSPV